jgi:hypothetical protein
VNGRKGQEVFSYKSMLVTDLNVPGPVLMLFLYQSSQKPSSVELSCCPSFTDKENKILTKEFVHLSNGVEADPQ